MAREKTTEFMAMKGAGHYSHFTVGAKQVLDDATGIVLDAVDRMETGGGVFRITDMGAADGGTSLDMWRRVLARIREGNPDLPVEIIYTDLPRNDFSQLFQTVHGMTDAQTYVGSTPNVHVMASGTSFHEAIVPAGSLDLGFSAAASHYITAVPCDIEDHVHMVGASGEVRAAFEAKGISDWDQMLAKRSAELKPDGRLCLFNLGIDEQGRYLGNTGGVNMFDTFAKLWRGLVEDGIISTSEFANTNFPQVYRTQSQFVAPLKDKKSTAYRSGLRLEHVESRVVRCPFEQAFSEGKCSADEFARNYIPTLRSWSEPTFKNGLDATRPAEQKARVIDVFYARYQDMVMRKPHGHGMDYVHVYLVCRKVK